MKALYVILGAFMVWMGGTALYNDEKLYRILFPVIALAAVFIFNAFRTRNKLEIISAVGAVFIAAAYATGFFHVGQAMGWAAGWMLVSGLFWIVTGVIAPERQEAFVEAVLVRSKRPSPTDENPFTSAKRGPVQNAEVVEPVAAAPAPPVAPAPAPVPHAVPPVAAGGI